MERTQGWLTGLFRQVSRREPHNGAVLEWTSKTGEPETYIYNHGRWERR